MDTIPGLNMLPEKWQPFALFTVLWLIPQLGRAYEALRNQGGLIGVWNAIVFGRSTPAVKDAVPMIQLPPKP